MIQTEGIFSGGSDIAAPIIGKDFSWTGGDGTYQVLDDGGGNWRIKFLSSGTFTPLKDVEIDAFLVGGGSAGCNSLRSSHGGNGGYTTTTKGIVLAKGTAYSVVIGAGGVYYVADGTPVGGAGGASSAFGVTANGGSQVSYSGDGGAGGCGGALARTNGLSIPGGSDGGNGGSQGQGTTTREFGEADGQLYSGGGGAYYNSNYHADPGAGGGGGYSGSPQPGDPNTGGGGCGTGGNAGGSGGSGIVVIRKHKEAAA